jgi:hypothetical protein
MRTVRKSQPRQPRYEVEDDLGDDDIIRIYEVWEGPTSERPVIVGHWENGCWVPSPDENGLTIVRLMSREEFKFMFGEEIS